MTRCELRGISLAAALACAAAVSAHAPVARAQAEDQAAARALFDEGRALMKAGQYADACPKLEAARRLFTSAGILLNLADCHEKIGRTARREMACHKPTMNFICESSPARSSNAAIT